MDAETNTAKNIDSDSSSILKQTQPFYRTQTFWILVLLFGSAFVLRLLLSNVMHGHPTDIVNFKSWSMHAARHPFAEFYKSVNPKVGIWADYPPLYILVLWLIGKFYMLFDPAIAQWSGPLFTLLIKLPPILADLGCMALLILILKRYLPFSIACFAALIFAIHPAVLYESAMWGQIDSVTLLLQLLAIWTLIRGDYAAAILITTLNILVKPQGLILFPFILLLTVYRRQYLHLAAGIGASLVVTFALTALFVPIQQIIPWLQNQYGAQADLYSFSSIQAFNVWSFTGMWASDTTRSILGQVGAPIPVLLQHKTWGLILFSIAYAFSLYFFWRNDRNGAEEGVNIWHTSSLIMIAFFLFPTRMHERYLYSGLFFLLGSWQLQHRLKWPFWIMSGTFMLNLFYELPGHKTELKFGQIFYNINNLLDSRVGIIGLPVDFAWYKLIAILNVFLFAWVVWILLSHPLKEFSSQLKANLESLFETMAQTAGKKNSLKQWIPAPIGLDRTDVLILAAILFSTALLKLWRLEYPAEMVFDEVYHARAAGEYLLMIKPLEWVHPPLAKLLIALGVMVYDLTGVGWRVVPVIAGTLLLVSVYCLGRFTLPHRWQAILGTLMLACDGVYFVQSRIAMTNIFATLFQVTALTLTWRFVQLYWHQPERRQNIVYFLSAILFIGLALSTRWTSLFSYGFIIGVLGLIVLVPSTLDLSALIARKVNWTIDKQVVFLWCFIPALTVLIPCILYLIAYIPYFKNYHYSFWCDYQTCFKHEQIEIWKYHKNLKDPHPYYSAWYTWPWLVRPTWYHFQSFPNNMLTGIIALGNPAIWWMSMPAVVALLALAWMRKQLNYFYLGIACLFMYLPWGLSPRTLNYAHYFFEAVPYACLSIAALMGVLVAEFKQKGKWISGIYFGLVVGLFFFFYPIYSALYIPNSYYNLLRWFPSWV